MPIRKCFVFIVLCLIFSTPCFPGDAEKLSNELVEFSKANNPEFDSVVSNDIQEWENRLRTELASKKDFREIIRSWEQFLYSEKNLKITGDAFFIDQVIRQESGTRLGVAGLWASLAENLNAPFFIILAPRHPFIVYDAGKVRKYLDIGTPHRTYGLDYFKRSAGFDKKKTSAAYFRPLKTQEIIALYRHALALEYVRAGKSEEAQKLILQAKSEFPGVAEFSSDLGQISFQTGKLDEAEKEFQEAVKIYPKDLTALQGLAQIAWRSGDLTRAKDYLGRIVEIDSENLDALHDLALIELIRSGLREADSYADSILHFKPDDPEALAYHATVQYLVGMRTTADENFETSLKTGLDDPRTVMALGMRYFLLGTHVDSGYLWRAMEYFRKAEEKDPSNWVIQYFIGQVYLAGREFSRAKESFENVLELAPKSSDALLHLAQVLIELGEFDSAKDLIAKAGDIDPEMPFLHFMRAVYDFRTGNSKAAVSEMKTAIKQAPYIEKNYWQLYLAQIYVENHELDEALPVVDGILEADSRYFKAYALRGRIYLEKKEFDKAEKDLMLASKYISKDGEVLLSLAKLNFQKKDYIAAWKYVRGAQAQGIQDPEFMSELRSESKESA